MANRRNNRRRNHGGNQAHNRDASFGGQGFQHETRRETSKRNLESFQDEVQGNRKTLQTDWRDLKRISDHLKQDLRITDRDRELRDEIVAEAREIRRQIRVVADELLTLSSSFPTASYDELLDLYNRHNTTYIPELRRLEERTQKLRDEVRRLNNNLNEGERVFLNQPSRFDLEPLRGGERLRKLVEQGSQALFDKWDEIVIKNLKITSLDHRSVQHIKTSMIQKTIREKMRKRKFPEQQVERMASMAADQIIKELIGVVRTEIDKYMRDTDIDSQVLSSLPEMRNRETEVLKLEKFRSLHPTIATDLDVAMKTHRRIIAELAIHQSGLLRGARREELRNFNEAYGFSRLGTFIRDYVLPNQKMEIGMGTSLSVSEITVDSGSSPNDGVITIKTEFSRQPIVVNARLSNSPAGVVRVDIDENGIKGKLSNNHKLSLSAFIRSLPQKIEQYYEDHRERGVQRIFVENGELRVQYPTFTV